MLYHKVNSCKCLKQSNFLLHYQICSFSLEHLMFLLNYLHNDIPWFCIRYLISFPMNGIFFTMRCSFVNFTFNYFLFFLNLLSIASFTLLLLINRLSLAITLITRACSLTVHAWTQLHHHCPHSFTFATFTSHYC